MATRVVINPDWGGTEHQHSRCLGCLMEEALMRVMGHLICVHCVWG